MFAGQSEGWYVLILVPKKLEDLETFNAVLQRGARDGKNAINCGAFSGPINGDYMFLNLARISIRSISKSLKSQNSEDTSYLLYVAKSTTQPRQLGLPSQSPLEQSYFINVLINAKLIIVLQGLLT